MALAFRSCDSIFSKASIIPVVVASSDGTRELLAQGFYYLGIIHD